MTLKARNRILILFFLLALLDTLLNAGLFIRSIMAETLSFPPDADIERQIALLSRLDLLAYEPLAVCISCLAFNAYALLTTLIIYLSFEKTQALETIYFLGFLLSCLAESTRLFIPVYALAQDAPASLAVLTRIVIGARMLAPLSFLFAELFSDTESRLFVERNLVIMLLASIFMGLLMPLHTGGYSSIFTYQWGIQDIFHLSRLLMVAATLLAIICKIAANYSTETIHEGIGFLISICGYFILCNSDAYILVIVGAGALFIGTVYYLRSMHQIYRWR